MGTEYSTMDCSELTILTSNAEQNWNELDLGRVGVLPTRSENVIGRETSRGE